MVTGIDGGRYKIEGSGAVGVRYSAPARQERTFSYSPADKAIVKYYYDTWVGEKGAKIDIELVKFIPAGK